MIVRLHTTVKKQQSFKWFFDLKSNLKQRCLDKYKKSTFDNSKNDPRIKRVSSESKNELQKLVKLFLLVVKLEMINVLHGA